MDFIKILAEMRQEQQQLGEAITLLERLAMPGTKRRGRPPGAITKVKEETPNKRGPGRPAGSRNKRSNTEASGGV